MSLIRRTRHRADVPETPHTGPNAAPESETPRAHLRAVWSEPGAKPNPRHADLLHWAGLSLLTKHPKRTDNPMLDEWNSAIVCVQSYLNGRVLGSDNDDEREYLLRLRAELNFLHISEADDAESSTV